MSEDIIVQEGVVLECLNEKVDLDGGNYIGSPLEAYIHQHCGADRDLSNLTSTGQAKLDAKANKSTTLSGYGITNAYTKSETYTKTEVDSKLASSSGTGDGKSITKTSDNKLQAVGVLDARNTSTALKYWTGTRSQYDAIATKDNNTIYNITDDTDVTLTLLEMLYPVGAIYIGMMATCPLQVLGVGMWSLKSANALVTSVDEIASVAGNGMALGFTNGNVNVGMSASSWTENGQLFTKNAYGKSVQTATVNSERTEGIMGVTTDATKSGIEATVTSTSIEVKIWERIS